MRLRRSRKISGFWGVDVHSVNPNKRYFPHRTKKFLSRYARTIAPRTIGAKVVYIVVNTKTIRVVAVVAPLPLTFHYPAYLLAHIFMQSLVHQRICVAEELTTEILTATLKLQLITPDMHLGVHTMDWTRDLHQLLLYRCKLHSLL